MFRVSLSQPSGKLVTVDYATADGSATGAPLNPQQDFYHASGHIVLTPTGPGYADITVMIRGDYRVEPNEMFSMTFTNPQNVVVPLGPGLAVGFINNDDNPPTLTVPSAQMSLEGRTPPAMTISAAVGAGMPGNVTVMVDTSPTGIVFANGAFGGTAHYSAWENSNYEDGLYKITVTAADEHGNSSTGTFDWQITDVALKELTGTEAAGASPKSVTVEGLEGAYLKTVEAVDLTYTTETAAAVPLAGHVLWRVTRYDGQSGTWQLWEGGYFPTLAQAPAPPNSGSTNPILRLEAGIDVDLNGTLATGEVTHKFDYGPNHTFFGSGITSQRTISVHGNQYKEDEGFRLSGNEHHELYSQFTFELDGDTGTVPVAWEIRPSNASSDNDPRIVRGTTATAVHAFQGGDAGNWIVRFFHDENGNGQRDGTEGTDYTSQNANAVGKGIEVKPMKIYALNVLYPSQQPEFANVSSPVVQSMLADNSAAAAKRDSFEDHRALISFQLNTLTGMALTNPNVYASPFSSENPDHVRAHGNNYTNYQIHLVSNADAHGVALRPGQIMVGNVPVTVVGSVVVFNWTDPGVNTIVHEIGHLKGLEHAGHAHGKYIMAAGSYGPPANELRADDVDPFELGL